MAQTVGQHGLAAFTNPSNGDPLDATIVKANDNSMRGAYLDHDNDPGIHVQSSALSARPIAGTAGRKWLTTDAGALKLWFDNGSTWEEISYLDSSSGLNATNLTSGTVPDARFPATLPAASGANLTSLNASNLASGTVPDARLPATLPAISGANLTNLNASNLATGTVPDGRFPATLPAASGANLTALNASNLSSGTVPDARFPATLPAASGVNLTALNASNLGSGTIPDARFPAVLPAVSGANLTNLPSGGSPSAGSLTGTTLASNVVTSSLTTVGTLTGLTLSGTTNLQDNLLQRPVIRDYGETRTAPTISAGSLTLNLENGNVFDVALNASITTLTISNPPASGTAGSFTLKLTADGTARTITWPAAVKWSGGTAPTLTSTNAKTDVLVFITMDAGTTWYAFVSGQNL